MLIAIQTYFVLNDVCCCSCITHLLYCCIETTTDSWWPLLSVMVLQVLLLVLLLQRLFCMPPSSIFLLIHALGWYVIRLCHTKRVTTSYHTLMMIVTEWFLLVVNDCICSAVSCECVSCGGKSMNFMMMTFLRVFWFIFDALQFFDASFVNIIIKGLCF